MRVAIKLAVVAVLLWVFRVWLYLLWDMFHTIWHMPIGTFVVDVAKIVLLLGAITLTPGLVWYVSDHLLALAEKGDQAIAKRRQS